MEKKEEIAKKIRSWDTERWKTDMEGKESLIIYRSWKKEVKEEQIYDNRYSSVLLLKARTDTLPLNYKNRHTGGDIKCIPCGASKEDINHFILECPEYKDIRPEIVELQQPYEEDGRRVIGKFLFDETNIEKKKEILQKLWRKRQKKIKVLNGQ